MQGRRAFGGRSLRVSGARWLAALGVPFQQTKSLARWSSSIVERYVGDAILSTLSSHVRRARKFQSAVHCPASSLDAPIGADLSPSYVDSDEEAGTAASPDDIIARLQTLLVVVNRRSGIVHRVVGDPSNSTGWQTRCGFRYRV